MFFLLFIKLLRRRRRGCVHSYHRLTAIWRQSWLAVWRAIPKRATNPPAALAEDLEHWLRHEPIQARRTGVFTRGRKWVRRNPASAVLVASLVALGAGMGVMFWERQSPRPLPPLPAGIAVLPFENLSADPENAFLTDGVQDEILNDLAKIADLKVISRTSVMGYKSGTKRNLRQIANELGRRACGRGKRATRRKSRPRQRAVNRRKN